MKLLRGVNLGGYLSQCKHSLEHYDEFIKEDDIKKIVEWGFDHIRFPIDYEVLEHKNGDDYVEGISYVNQVISWCQEYGIDVVLDLHKAYGYDFNDVGDAEKNNLFSDEALKKRFVDLWIRMAKRYGSFKFVAFELLNEVVEEENAAVWNDLINQTVKAI
ncbi:MAG: cellulase family glycosylhydrolase, partial [Lachnospiraceae bacterium]|nr:cellulase family glycosylhydrolase [Lachnospiraceae bacterium]